MTIPQSLAATTLFVAALYGIWRLYLLHQAEEALKSDAQKAQDFEDQQW